MILWKNLQALCTVRSSCSLTVYFNCASLNFQQNVLMTCLTLFTSWNSIVTMAYFYEASRWIMKCLLGSGYMHRMAFATTSFVLSKACYCSSPQIKGWSFLVSFVIGAMISAWFRIWFLIKWIVSRKPLTFLTLWGWASLRITSIHFFVGWNLVYFKQNPRNLTSNKQSSLLLRLTCISLSLRQGDFI